jgi:hypothetical protein
MIFIFLVAFFLKIEPAMSGTNILYDRALYHKCFSLFFERFPEKNDSLLRQVVSGKINGQQACGKLIDELNFDKNGKIEKSHLFSKDLLLHALSLIQKHHVGWFTSYDFTFTEKNWGSVEIYDSGQPALYFTNAFFANLPLRELLKGKSQPYALRYADKKPEFLIYKKNNNKIRYDDIVLSYKDEETPPVLMKQIEWVARGVLVGITLQPKKYFVERAYVDLKTGYETVSQDIYQSFGGGILGSTVFLMLNQGQPVSSEMDGEVKVFRRWSKAVLNDLLCRSLPVLKPEDSVHALDVKSKVTFKKDNSCYICHHTMDPMAGLIRNVSSFINNSDGVTFDNDGNLIEEKDKRNLQFTYLRDLHKNPLKNRSNPYVQTAATGQFNFRNLDGKMISKNLNSLDELGSNIAETPDYYNCIVQRYLKFATGLDVQIDPNFINSTTDSNEKLNNRKLVSDLAKRLHKSQSIKSLLKEIINTKEFSILK